MAHFQRTRDELVVEWYEELWASSVLHCQEKFPSSGCRRLHLFHRIGCSFGFQIHNRWKPIQINKLSGESKFPTNHIRLYHLTEDKSTNRVQRFVWIWEKLSKSVLSRPKKTVALLLKESLKTRVIYVYINRQPYQLFLNHQ